MTKNSGYRHFLRMYAIFALIELLFAFFLVLSLRGLNSDDIGHIVGGSIYLIFSFFFALGVMCPIVAFAILGLVAGSRGDEKIVHLIISFALIILTFLGIFIGLITNGPKLALVLSCLLMASCAYASVSGFIVAHKSRKAA